ncbi:MAG: SDR family NAD(P)-dependent oxidoreductase [Gammaproteobacteria bacterium]|nr:SDR family NAD(P)-dependent oxidoreductase [Gammaproteobacteria bacterium]
MTYKLEMLEQFDAPRSLDDAFDYIVDFSRIDEWDHTIVSAKKVSDGAIGLGTRFDVVFSMGPRKTPIAYEITEFDYPNRAVLTGTSDNFTAVDTVTLSKTAQGCHVNWHAELEFKGTAAKLVPLLEKKIKAGGAKTIRDLAVALRDDFEVPKLAPLRSLADKLVLPGVLTFTKYGYSSAQKDWRPVSASIKNKHVVITGATSGLGLSAAQQLAHLGARLTLVARDRQKAKDVVADIKRQTGNTNIKVEIAELSSMAQVSALAERLLKRGQAIDVLVNNAGALLNPREETDEGIEKSFALLLLGPYVLTEKLQPLLAKAGAARVINVSSGGMYAKRLSISNIESDKGEYSGSDAYARAKRGLVITGEQWAEEWAGDGITVHNMHPGWAYTPGVVTGLPEFTKATRKVLRTPEQGADTIVWLARATEVGKTSGLFWLDRHPHTTHLTSSTRETAQQRDQLRATLQSYRQRLGV